MFERLKDIKKRYDSITEELIKPEVISDVSKTTKLSKEQSDLSEIIECYNEYLKVTKDYEDAKKLAHDPEMASFALEEEEKNLAKQKELEKELEILLLPKDPNDGKNIIVEIRGAAGGDEANIFAGDLYNMYIKYAENQGFTIENLGSTPGASGGYSEISFMIKGKNVYSKLKYESGAHRVQRVPKTESQGRVHTSTSTVLVMPEIDDANFDIDMNDVRIDITRASGNGGQGVNTTDSAVRLTHVPTGIVVYSQTERSQIKNKEKGLKILKSRVYDLKMREQEKEIGIERRNKIGTGDRSEKIRTYNYPQSRVTDHRIGYTTNTLDRVMNGKLDDIIEALITEDQRRRLAGE